jgi:hypothetical protein
MNEVGEMIREHVISLSGEISWPARSADFFTLIISFGGT